MVFHLVVSFDLESKKIKKLINYRHCLLYCHHHHLHHHRLRHHHCDYLMHVLQLRMLLWLHYLLNLLKGDRSVKNNYRNGVLVFNFKQYNETDSKNSLTAIWFAARTCVCKFNSVFIHAPAYTNGTVTLRWFVKSLNIAIRCVAT